MIDQLLAASKTIEESCAAAHKSLQPLAVGTHPHARAVQKILLKLEQKEVGAALIRIEALAGELSAAAKPTA